MAGRATKVVEAQKNAAPTPNRRVWKSFTTHDSACRLSENERNVTNRARTVGVVENYDIVIAVLRGLRRAEN